MTFMNRDASIRQFALMEFVNENSGDEHVISKISIVLRRDKIEAPYYMDTKIRMSTCLDRPDNGLIHAMNLMNHNRMYNLTEDAYSEIRTLLCDAFKSDDESEQVKIFKEDKRLKIVLTSKSKGEMKRIFQKYGKVFEKIDGLID